MVVGPATSTAITPYESPEPLVLGTVQELTEFCFLTKKSGDPDYFNFIPIAHCSA